MNRIPSFAVAVLFAPVLFSADAALAQTAPQARPAAAMERTEHEWTGAGRSSKFSAYWTGAELKMIREEYAPSSGTIEKNEFFYNAGALLHYKHDSYPEPGKTGVTIAVMVSFDKSGNPLVSMKRVDGKPVGAASPAEITRGRKHLEELLAIVRKARP